RIAIEHAPTDPLPYQRLLEACARTGRELAAALLATVVSLLEGDDRPGIVLPDPVPGALPPDAVLGLFVGATRAPDVRRLAAHLDPHLHALFDEKAKLDGAVPLPESYPVVPVIRAIAAALGAPAIGLSWRERADLTLVATDPAVLVLSPRQVKDDPARLRFGLGYVLARLAGGSAIAHLGPLEQVQAMFVAITDPEGDKRVSAALPRRARKELEKLAPELAGVDAPHVALWDAEERQRGLACGVIASCDLRTVAAAVCPDALAGTPADRRGRLGSSPMLVEALRLATTEACWTALARFYGRA
ncbi:MAG: hypothetical protein NT062_33340, partial [Proteobacteria bacterium]|nr:hypothetical protein [Pseudomonadota bacterium]